MCQPNWRCGDDKNKETDKFALEPGVIYASYRVGPGLGRL